MANISEILKQVEPAFGKFTKEMIEKFKENLLRVFKNEAAAEIKQAFLNVYDELAETEEGQAGARIRGKDPSSLKNLRPLFEAHVSIEGDEIVIRLMNKSDLGFGRQGSPEGRPTTVDVLSFYLEGVAGEFGFITPEHYTAQGRQSSRPLGRFGAGFLIPRDRYRRERWEEVTGIPFEEIRHPISGQPPFRGFEEIPAKLNFSKYIERALVQTRTAFEGRNVR